MHEIKQSDRIGPIEWISKGFDWKRKINQLCIGYFMMVIFWFHFSILPFLSGHIVTSLSWIVSISLVAQYIILLHSSLINI
ncbi:uncharacterized protein BX664DRAFT_330262 [Halteromyces radiatus]|uniref:uncharacterized protein n=1 Tax=Halteromyces radiatus TaxID=101107 RepID=UPI00221E3F2B|nr:uncharacterized protein BX664DRAFT_330262 [Halteromyces radiatus]KAI8093660.1 hypothetical protein BX664DRAFT_330262 [Halteromyces radiatus]